MSLVALTLKKMERFMWIYIISWNGWFIPVILVSGFNMQSPCIVTTVIQSAAVFFALIWTIYLVRLNGLTKFINKNDHLKEAFRDDFMVNAKMKCGNWGFFGALFTAAVMSVVSDIFELSGVAASSIVILIAVDVYLVSYLVILKGGDAGE